MNKDNVSQTWQDVNGDGLQDMVYDSDEVRLNLGYNFTKKIKYDIVTTQGESISLAPGINLGVSDNFASFSVGTGLSLSRSLPLIQSIDLNNDGLVDNLEIDKACLLYTSPSPRDQRGSRMPSSA